MAAEMVTSAVAQEAVNQVLSRFKERRKKMSEAKEHIERMEMAHIKLEAALETSSKWEVTSAPLICWRSKLKHASQECDNTLRRCRQRLQEEEEMQDSVKTSSFPMQITYAARSFVSSMFNRGSNDDELRGPTAVRRFERFANGASEFLRYVELGGTPRRFTFFDSLVRHLLAGKGTKYCIVLGSQHLSFVLQPFRTPDHGVDCSLVFLLKDSNASNNNFHLTLSLRLSESTDIVGVAVNCLQLFIPQWSSIVETVKTKLTQVPTQDLRWVSSVCERQNNLYSAFSQWFQPNPLCCHQQAHSYNATSSSSESLLCDIYLEPVMNMYLLGHVPLSVGNNKQRLVIDGESKTSCAKDLPYLKLGMQFWPHTSFEDLSPRDDGSATEMINGEAMQHRGLYANISFGQLGKMMVPKAVDCLYGNAAATSYEMLWKSKHGGAYFRVEKMSTARKEMGGKHSEQRQVTKVQGWASANSDFINSFIAHTPAKLLGTAMDWFQKQKRLPQPLLLKTNSCVHDCPIMLLSLQYFRSLARKITFSMLNA